MRKILGCVGSLATMAALIVTAFLSIGGWQMITVMRGPKLPAHPQRGLPGPDLEYLRQVVRENERGVTDDVLDQFEKTIRTLSATPPANADTASIIAARALAKLENAHSTLTDPRLHRLPIRVHWFCDGLVVVKARPEWAHLVGSKILAIGGKRPEQLLEQMAELAAGNNSWLRYRSEYFLVAPAAIAFLGGQVNDFAVSLVTVDPTGKESSSSLDADRDVLPADAFWEWEHQLPSDTSFKTNGWQTLLTIEDTLPLYLQDPQRLLLLRDLPEFDAVYVRMNGSINDDNISLKQFGEDSLTLIAQRQRKNVIIDFRFNWGGGYDLTTKFTRQLPRNLRAGGNIFLITGPNTFSAGLIASARLKHFGDNVMIVGQPAGDELQFRAEGFLVSLPATGMKAYVSTARHDFQHPIGWFSDCYFLDKFYGVAVDSIAPDVIVENTSDAYRNRRDQVIETIFKRVGGKDR